MAEAVKKVSAAGEGMGNTALQGLVQLAIQKSKDKIERESNAAQLQLQAQDQQFKQQLAVMQSQASISMDQLKMQLEQQRFEQDQQRLNDKSEWEKEMDLKQFELEQASLDGTLEHQRQQREQEERQTQLQEQEFALQQKIHEDHVARVEEATKRWDADQKRIDELQKQYDNAFEQTGEKKVELEEKIISAQNEAALQESNMLAGIEVREALSQRDFENIINSEEALQVMEDQGRQLTEMNTLDLMGRVFDEVLDKTASQKDGTFVGSKWDDLRDLGSTHRDAWHKILTAKDKEKQGWREKRQSDAVEFLATVLGGTLGNLSEMIEGPEATGAADKQKLRGEITVKLRNLFTMMLSDDQGNEARIQDLRDEMAVDFGALFDSTMGGISSLIVSGNLEDPATLQQIMNGLGVEEGTGQGRYSKKQINKVVDTLKGVQRAFTADDGSNLYTKWFKGKDSLDYMRDDIVAADRAEKLFKAVTGGDDPFNMAALLRRDDLWDDRGMLRESVLQEAMENYVAESVTKHEASRFETRQIQAVASFWVNKKVRQLNAMGQGGFDVKSFFQTDKDGDGVADAWQMSTHDALQALSDMRARTAGDILKLRTEQSSLDQRLDSRSRSVEAEARRASDRFNVGVYR